MRWRRGFRLLAASLLSSQVALSTGCAGDRPQVDGFSPDFATLLQLPGSESHVARGQKPAQAATKSLLELGANTANDKETRSARIRATVNGEAILDEEVSAAAFQSLVGAKTDAEKVEILNKHLNDIIDRELIIQDAVARLNKRSGPKFLQELEKHGERAFLEQWLYRLMRANKYTDEVAFINLLREQGLPVELIKRQWVRNFISMEYLRSRIVPQLDRIGHQQIVEYYDSHLDEFKVDDNIVWQDIFIANARHPTPQAARQFAEVLLARIKKGEDFIRLAKEFDNGDSSLRPNAEGLGNVRGKVNPREAEAILFRLKDGEVGPLIELETGYHIVRLTKRTYAGRRPFDDQTQKVIRAKLKEEAFQQEMKKLVNNLKRNAIIEVVSDTK
jgi:parvulin-like peptidyl-prolyl isomerase